ncbi:MAG: PTS sugar transporter subunit IIA [Propionicimonas sp.]
MGAADPLFRADLVFLNRAAESPEQLLTDLARKLSARGLVTAEFEASVLAREARFPTGLPGPVVDIAVPHTDPEHIMKAFIAVVRTEAGVPFVEMATLDKRLSARLVFLLGFKDNSNQVRVLQALIENVLQGDLAEKLMLCADPQEAMGFLEGLESQFSKSA